MNVMKLRNKFFEKYKKNSKRKDFSAYGLSCFWVKVKGAECEGFEIKDANFEGWDFEDSSFNSVSLEEVNFRNVSFKFF